MGAPMKLESPRHGLPRHARPGWSISTLASMTMLIATVIALLDLARRQSFSWPRQETPSSPSLGALRFQPDGTFQISIFEDLHFGENAWDSWGPQQDVESVKVLDAILDAEATIDLVVLNGDLITGDNTFRENSTFYVDQIVSPLVKRGLTWASTYGNHDSAYNLSRADLLAREQTWPGARTQSMVSGDVGATNYYLPVYDADCEDSGGDGCTPALLLWFFDSRGGFRYQKTDASTGELVGQPDWVDKRVVEWFQQTNAELVEQAGRAIPALAFVHIPTNASLAFQGVGVDKHRQPGIDDDRPVAQQGQGWCADGRNDGSCEYGGQDVAFMAAVASTPGLLAVFSGHDHGNTWCYKWDRQLPGMSIAGTGVNLCFGQHSGYGGYGNWIRGARQVVASVQKLAGSVVDTYVRLESGDVVGAVCLNATFGKDRYPATKNDKTRCRACKY
ncbi:Metallo-dependent phosphatase-like protein [Echria macrotheca]|uniref:Metallo-dependent phosphatase-like protein n=1 Tax=Echria macrotheca TaxID=438768 RepID=A0AAJ0B8E2_9PEZI|nr:Metallo-dependent phosphatase-like protein [Echria macrotheca]